MVAEALLVDTHCHIHDTSFSKKFENKNPDEMIAEAAKAGVTKLICVGTDISSSEQAVSFCSTREMCFASIALHPHEAAALDDEQLYTGIERLHSMLEARPQRLVAIGECGLDYFYHDDSAVRKKQAKLLHAHLQLAQKYKLPVIFHIRDAFPDFFSIFDQYSGLRGVVHSFSASPAELDEVLKRNLYIGLNGIMTFTKDESQLNAAKQVPIEKLLIETDAPFLTPVPFRGKMCVPKHAATTAQFLNQLRGESYDTIAHATTQNAQSLFGI